MANEMGDKFPHADKAYAYDGAGAEKELGPVAPRRSRAVPEGAEARSARGGTSTPASSSRRSTPEQGGRRRRSMPQSRRRPIYANYLRRPRSQARVVRGSRRLGGGAPRRGAEGRQRVLSLRVRARGATARASRSRRRSRRVSAARSRDALATALKLAAVARRCAYRVRCLSGRSHRQGRRRSWRA